MAVIFFISFQMLSATMVTGYITLEILFQQQTAVILVSAAMVALDVPTSCALLQVNFLKL